jgi:hypothetical protein
MRVSDKPVIEMFDRRRMIPHPFIVQCIWPGCTEHFSNHDKLKEHLNEVHKADQDEINRFELLALMLV